MFKIEVYKTFYDARNVNYSSVLAKLHTRSTHKPSTNTLVKINGSNKPYFADITYPDGFEVRYADLLVDLPP